MKIIIIIIITFRLNIFQMITDIMDVVQKFYRIIDDVHNKPIKWKQKINKKK